MLWSYWRYSRNSGLQVPRRFNAYRSSTAARAAATEPIRRVRRHKIVALVLREQGDNSVVPEFYVAAVGDHWSLPARWDVDHFVVTGEVPQALWYEEADS